VDSGGGSVVLSTVQVVVEINGVPETAVLNGAFTAGWVGSSMVAVPNGYQFTLVRTTPYGSSATIEFFIDASDDVVPPNAMATFSCALTTAFFTPVCRLAECRIVSLLGGIIQLDARESSSPDGATLDFEWKFTQVPMGSVFEADVGVVNPASVKDLRPSTYSAISFIPDKLGDYLVELTAVNGLSRSDPCTALVSIGLSRTLCGSGKVPDAEFLWGFFSNFWSLVEDRQYFPALWSGQMQLIGAEMVKLWSNDYNKSLDTIQPTVQRRWQQFPLHTELGDRAQRVIVGNTKAGIAGNTGDVGGGGVGTTQVLNTLFLDEDFTTIDVNYGAKGRIIDINGTAFTIERVYNVNSGAFTWGNTLWGQGPWGAGIDYSVAVVDEDAVVDGQTNIPYRIPHLIHFPLFNLEDEGVRAGDTLVLEWTRGDAGLTAEMSVRVVAVDRERIGFEFGIAEPAVGAQVLDYDLFEQLVQDLKIVPPGATDTEIASAANAVIAFVPSGINLSSRPFSVFQLTVKAGKVIHNSAKKIDDLYVSIPALQEEVREDPPVILRENFDYFVEGGFLAFVDGLFSAESPAPEELWAECSHIDNTPTVEANFGRLVELGPDDLVEKATRAPYLNAVRGLWFALTNGPTVANLRLGLQILMGLPFSVARGKILDITNNFSTDSFGKPIGRILSEDVDEDDDRGLGIRRFYFFPEDVGIEDNPLTSLPYAVGDIMEAFQPLSKGIDVTDYVKDPEWWLTTLANNEILKFFLFRAQIDVESGVFDSNDLVFSLEFIRKIKPVYTDVVAAVLRSLSDDVMASFADDLKESKITQHFYENAGAFGGHESTVRANDFNHQGITLWRGDSRPLSTRTPVTLRDIVTQQNGATVEATSATGFGLFRSRVTGDASHPTIEGDLLALWPGQPGAGAFTPRFFEITASAGVNGPIDLGNEVSLAEPVTMDVNAPDADLFQYGTDLVASVVRRAWHPKVRGSDLVVATGAIDIGTSASASFILDGVQLDDHVIIDAGVNAGEYRVVSVVAQTIPRDYTPAGVPQISTTQVGLVPLPGSPALSNDAVGRDFRIISPAMIRTRVERAQIIQSGGNMFAEVLDPNTGFPFDVFTPGMIGATLVVQDAQNPLNNGVYTIQPAGYVHAGRVQITTGSPQTSDAAATAVVTIRSAFHPGFEKAEELAPTEVFSAVVV
jgi:hypothetical protein